MEPSLVVLAFLGLFSATHIGLATRAVRTPLVAHLGERGFTLVFSGVAAVSFSLLVIGYSRLRFLGAAGPGLGSVPILGAALGLGVGLGIVLMLASFATYPSSPMGANLRSLRPPRGLERITRHPFFAGVVLFGLAHALLAPRLVGTALFAGLALHAGLGAWHQDRKLLRKWGEPYADFLSASSALPFAALLTGRQRFVWGELSWVALSIGVAAAFGLRAVHGSIFAHDGVGVIAVTVGGAAIALAAQWRGIPGREAVAGRAPERTHAA